MARGCKRTSASQCCEGETVQVQKHEGTKPRPNEDVDIVKAQPSLELFA